MLEKDFIPILYSITDDKYDGKSACMHLSSME